MTGIRNKFIRSCTGIVLLAVFVSPAPASSRVALVIGNAAYEHVPNLANPLNDAADIGAALGNLDFAVTRIENVGYDALRKELRAFRRKASTARVAVVFYAGHGIEVNNQNFVVPVDAGLRTDGDVEYEAVSVDLVMGAVHGASEFRLVVLDACRDNPFAAKMKREKGSTRSIGRGLARVEPTGGSTLLAYSAKHGTTAQDGQGRNSPYASALLRFLHEPGLEVGLLFRNVRDAVYEATGGEQEPFAYGSLSAKKVYFVPPVPGHAASKTSVAATDSAVDLEYWKTINAIENPEARIAALLDYKAKFPGGKYVNLADIRLKALSKPVAAHQPALETVDQGGPTQAAQGVVRLQGALHQNESGEANVTGGREGIAEQAARDLAFVGEFRECPQCPQMLVVPAGTYEMGSPSGEGANDEEHRHRVTIPEPIAIGMFEVKRAEFTHFMEETNRSGGSACWQYDGAETKETSGPADPGFIQGENEPMVCVSWEDAQAYVEWLSSKTQTRYRLLSEAEWEYAARGGTVAPRYWDESESGQCGNANGADAALRTRYADWFELTAPCDDGRPHTSEAGSYGPNAFGLYDMLGNAREWVADCWNGDYTDAPKDGSAWIKSGNCDLRVLRGGSWLDGPGGVRSSTRDKGITGIRFSANGFRVARALD